MCVDDDDLTPYIDHHHICGSQQLSPHHSIGSLNSPLSHDIHVGEEDKGPRETCASTSFHHFDAVWEIQLLHPTTNLCG